MAISDLNYFLALGAVATQLLAVGLFIIFLLRRKVPAFGDIVASIGSIGLWGAFFVTLGVAGMTLYYESLGFEPCPLCWWQRVFLYPQVILLGAALWREKYRAAAIDFSIVFSVIGGAIALYHHALQMAPMGTLPCPATGPSCAQRIFFEFDYITFPLMALSVFVFLIVVLIIVRSRRVQ